MFLTSIDHFFQIFECRPVQNRNNVSVAFILKILYLNKSSNAIYFKEYQRFYINCKFRWRYQSDKIKIHVLQYERNEFDIIQYAIKVSFYSGS